MADNFKQNKKDAKEILETQLRIEETIKRQTASWSSYVDAQKDGLENAKKIKQINERIAVLTAENTAESKAEAAELEKQVDYLRGLNKELLKTKTLLKAAAKATSKWSLEKLALGGKNLLDMYNKMDKSARRNAVSIGMSATRMKQFKTVAAGSAEQLTILGLEVESAGEMMGALNEATGRQLMLSVENVKAIGNLSERLGMSHQEVAGMAGQMENFGFGVEDSISLMSEISDISDKMGVNTQKVLKKVGSNLKLVNKLNFKDGVKGMAKMAAYTEKYKLSMEAVAGLAEKVFRPEGAIDAAANLQVLGGSLAQMGDPFQMMYQARNAPEELAKSITKAAAATAEWDEASKEFKVNAYELDRLKEASEATGISLDDLVTTAKQTARMNMFEGMIGKGVGKDEKEFLTSIAQMKNGKASINVGFDKNNNAIWKPLSEFSNAEVKTMMQKKENDEKAALMAQTTQERILNMWNSILAKLMPALDGIEQEWGPKLIKFGEYLIGGIKSFLDSPTMQKFALGLLALPTTLKLLSPIGFLINLIRGKIMWYKNGLALRKGFEAGGVASPMGRQSGAGSSFAKARERAGITRGADGRMVRNTSPISQTSPTPQQTSPTGRQGGFMNSLSKVRPSQLLALGAAMIMIGGAIWIVADAMVRMKEAGVGFSEMMGVLVGSLAIMIPLVATLGMVGSLTAGPILALGAAFLMVGGAIWLATQGFAAMFEAIGPNGDSILKAGLGMLSMAGGIAVLTASLVALGVAAPIVGIGLLALWGVTELLVDTAEKLEKTNIGTLVQDINAIDKEKLSMLKGLLSLSKDSKPIVVKFDDLKVDGNIDLKGGGGSVSMLMQEPYLSKLKDLIWDAMEKGRKSKYG
jgi:hypothetical protein